MKKISINTSFLINPEDLNQTVSKLKFELTVVDSDTGEVYIIPKSHEVELGDILQKVLSRWDKSNFKMTLTKPQWNLLLGKIEKNKIQKK